VQITKHIYDGLVILKDIIPGLDHCNEKFNHQCTTFAFGGQHPKLVEAHFGQLGYINDNDQLPQPILHMVNDCLCFFMICLDH
jgi:hypothetical protein